MRTVKKGSPKAMEAGTAVSARDSPTSFFFVFFLIFLIFLIFLKFGFGPRRDSNHPRSGLGVGTLSRLGHEGRAETKPVFHSRF